MQLRTLLSLLHLWLQLYYSFSRNKFISDLNGAKKKKDFYAVNEKMQKLQKSKNPTEQHFTSNYLLS